MRIASIDLGTNTFNLLIADISGNTINLVHRDKRGVKLGRNGINRHTICPDAWQRGMDALKDYSKDIEKYNPDKVIATATSAMRNADNGVEFVNTALETTGISIQIIDGKEEARLIFEGVKNALPLYEEPSLIMDIGGGSIEFIIADNAGIIWHNSFEAGASRLLEQFSPSEPILENEIKAIENHAENQLHELFTKTEKYKPQILIGSSGSFDAIANMASFIINNYGIDISSKYFEIPCDIYNKIHLLILKSDLEQRKKIPGMDLIRVELIVIGSILINFVINKLSVKKLIQSSYAIKEGVIFDAVQKNLKQI
ncbi:MAG: hypothetical protein A2487_18040 [Candidatus Raymondbacteria bacterium RifOxyC12_full_50_8]|nr:MAG: hypothetical protein A2487_18040 [Candidatus Raymondbacteria bacterium RifOxyC12_full_50_8]